MVATQRRPILSQSCRLATTAAEYRYRIDRPNSAPRVSRVIALDEGATALVEELAKQTWVGARFLIYEASTPQDGDQPPDEARLRATDGAKHRLTDQLVGADVAVMIATSDAGSEAATIIGRACAQRGVMTAGLVVGDRAGAEEAITTLRPNAMVLVVLDDEHDAVDVLTALRA